MKSLRLGITLIFTLIMSMAIGQNIHKQVKTYNKAGHVDSSYMLLERAIERHKSIEDWDSLAIVLNLKSEVITRDKTQAEQLSLAKSHKTIIKNRLGEDHSEYLNSVFHLSRIQISNGLLKEATSGFDLIIEKDKSLQSKEQHGLMATVNKAYIMLYSNKIKEAMSLTEEALSSYKVGIDTFFFIAAYQVMSIGHSYNHEIDKVIEYDHLSLDINTKQFGRNHPNVGLTLDHLGGAYTEIGQYDLALDHHNKAKAIQNAFYKKTGNGNFLGNVLGNTSLTYSNIGEYQLAFENIEQAIQIQESQFDELNINLLWYYEAAVEILIKSERYNKAQYYMDKAIRIVTMNPEATDYDKYFVKSYQSELFYKDRKYDLALKMAEDVYHYLSSQEEKTVKDIAHITSVLADIQTDRKEFSESKKWIKIAQDNVKSYYTSIHSETLNSHTRTMYLNQQMENHEGNELLYQEILKERNNGDKSITLRNCIPDQYMLSICQFYSSSLYTLIKSGKIDKQIYFDFLSDFEAYYEVHLSAIRSNSRLQEESRLLKAIYFPGISLLSESAPEKVILLTEKIKSFHTRLILKNQLIKQGEKEMKFSDQITSFLESSQDSNQLSTFVEVGQLIEEFKNYKDSLYQNDIEKYRLNYGLKEVELSVIKNNLKENELLIEYFQYDSLIYAIFVSHSESKIKKIDISELDLLMNNQISNRTKSNSQLVYDLILAHELVGQYDKLLIVPDDKLFFLNFEELVAPSGQYLLESKTIRYAYSASILDQQKALTTMDRSNKNILGLTPGFSSQMKESYIKASKGGIVDSSWLYFIQQPFLLNLASNLATIDNSSSLISQEATETKYKSESSNFKILHLGTHGILNDESPLFSKLIFAKDSIEDGYLHTYEIYGQNLNADLAVLSACNSGNGKIVEGEGVLSLAHAFTHAGCPSTLMTLWDVDEKSTAIILESFYKNLKSGQLKSEALRNAKLSFLDSAPQELQDPYYWAGLVLIGSDEALFSNDNNWWIAIAIILTLLLLIFFLKNRKRNI